MLKQILFTNPLKNMPIETKRKRFKVLLLPVEVVRRPATIVVLLESVVPPLSAVSERIAPKNIDRHGMHTP